MENWNVDVNDNSEHERPRSGMRTKRPSDVLGYIQGLSDRNVTCCFKNSKKCK